MRAFLGLGSNLGDRVGQLQRAVQAAAEVVAVSPVYESAPVGGPDQGPYLNLVVQLETAASPEELLGRCRLLEQQAGRERRTRWGPRTLDVDVLWIDGVSITTPELTVPHPRMHQRNFVMAPLLDLDPSFSHPHYRPESAVGDVWVLGDLKDLSSIDPGPTASDGFRR